MDLTSGNIAFYLPWLLSEVATSCFVAMDLEMSGIALSVKYQGTKSLQKHYEENKAAAEKYQVLQVGLTICREDKERGSYVLRPYNISLNPCLDRNLNVNRDCTFMGWSMEFLAGHRFDVGSLFTHGVRYLSRDEEIAAREEAVRRWAPTDPMDNIEHKLRDEADIKFLEAVRCQIETWIAGGKTRGTYLSIPPTTNGHGKVRQGCPNDLSKTQKWLIHNLVKTEFPSLKSRGMPTYIQIEQRNGGAMEFNDRIRESDQRIRKHVGFRWIVEALAGGDLSELEPATFADLLPEDTDPSITAKVLADRIKERLKENRPILVGHNSFTDMVFFYRCFLGPLPNAVEEFIALIHETFPILVDTKFLATQDFDAMNLSSSLEELNKTLAKITSPRIETDSLYSKYFCKRSAHEAGYDSMLTAIAFLKLSTHLEDGKLPKGTRGRLEDIAYRLVTPTTTVVQDLFPSIPQDPFREFFNTEDEEKEQQQAEELGLETVALSIAYTGSKSDNDKVRQKLLIPRLGSKFWLEYGNKLRVFGTTEKTAYFGPIEKPAHLRARKKTKNSGANGANGANGGVSDDEELAINTNLIYL